MSNRAFKIASLLVVLLVAATALAARPQFNGSYEMRFAGEWSGTGKASVGSSNVNINGKLTDPAGNTLDLKAKGTATADGHFTGDGTLGGKAITISGRLEDGVGKKSARIVGSINDAANRRYGRFAGGQKNS
jgi:hypothetical protein